MNIIKFKLYFEYILNLPNSKSISIVSAIFVIDLYNISDSAKLIMSIINPAAVIKAVSREVFHKYGDNDIEPTGDDLTFAYLLVKMISQKFKGEQYTIKPTAAGVTPPTHAITGIPPPIIPGVVNPLNWRSPVPPMVMAIPNTLPTIAPAGLVPANVAAATPAAKLNRPMISEQDIQRRAFTNQVSPEIRDEAYDWQEYKTPDNKLYYYHSKTKERTWTKPEIIIKLDQEIAVIREQKSRQNKTIAATSSSSSSTRSPVHSQPKNYGSPSILDSNSHNRTNATTSTNMNKFNNDNNNTNNNNSQQDNDNSKTYNNSDNNRNKNSTNASSNTSMKPVSTTAIPGTTWCVVWTDKKRVFYFNQSTKTSVWERPAELKFREDVDAIVRGEDVTSRNDNSNSEGGPGVRRSDIENSHESDTLSYSLKRMKQ